MEMFTRLAHSFDLSLGFVEKKFKEISDIYVEKALNGRNGMKLARANDVLHRKWVKRYASIKPFKQHSVNGCLSMPRACWRVILQSASTLGVGGTDLKGWRWISKYVLLRGIGPEASLQPVF